MLPHGDTEDRELHGGVQRNVNVAKPGCVELPMTTEKEEGAAGTTLKARTAPEIQHVGQ